MHLRDRRLILLALAVAFIALLLLAVAPAATADFTVTGDWTITGIEGYANETITLLNTTGSEGNVTVMANATLTLENVTLVMPFHSSFVVFGQADVSNSTLRGESWQFWILSRTSVVDSSVVNATDGGTIVDSTDTLFTRVNWTCGGGGSGGVIHVHRVIDFRNNTLWPGCVVSFALPPLSADKSVEISGNVFVGGASDSAMHFPDVYHTGQVVFNIHDNSLNGGGNAVEIGAMSPTTTFLIHHSYFANTGVATIRALGFGGVLRVWNVTFENDYRALRLEGPAGSNILATFENSSVNGTQDGILAAEATLVIRNSTISSLNPQYVAGTNGRILIYDTADNAFASGSPSTGGSIEHFVFLNMSSPTWQGAVPITDDLVSLRTAAGPSYLNVVPSNWTPQLVVWWGMYPAGADVDNRELHPAIVDGSRTFNCTPALFFASPGMSRVDVTCTDDFIPTLSVSTPGAPSLQNTSTVRASGQVVELGAGLSLVEWSLDGVSYSPVTINGTDPRNISLVAPNVADGAYSLRLRATDRVGNTRTLNWGPITIDTVVPSLGIVSLPEFVSASSLRIEGVTEPNTTVKATRAGGFQNQTRSSAIGIFALEVLLEEGLNTYTVTATDAAGNSMSLSATTTVDTVAPPLLVLLEGAPDAIARLRLPLLHITGSTEPTATVAVDGAPASRSTSSFSFDLPLTRGVNNVTVTATDRAGNIAYWFGVALFDDEPPSLRFNVSGIDAASPLPILTRSGSVTVEGQAYDPTTGVVSLVVNGATFATDASGFFSLAISLLEGNNTIAVSASDAVGNVVTISVRVVKDTQAPSLTLSVVEDGAPIVFLEGLAYTNGTTARLALLVTESARATIAGQPYTLDAGSNAFTLPLVEGRNTFALTVTDGAGNAAPPSTVVVVRDTVPPPLSILQPTAGAFVSTAVVEVVGAAEPFATVLVNGQATTVSAAGEFRVVVALDEGSNTIRVTAADQVGNTNSTSITVSHSAQSPNNPAGGAESLPLLWLGLGLAAGAVIGALVMRSRSPRAEKAPSTAAEVTAPRGPQGPRPPQT